MHQDQKQPKRRPRPPRVVLLKDLATEESFEHVTGGDAKRKLVFGARRAEDGDKLSGR